jgi:imidazole glycerol phosphate synthase subunit HisF
MTRLSTGSLLVALSAAVLHPSVTRGADDVSINGVAVPKATSTMDGTQDVSEFRAGGDPTILLFPGAKRYGVCLVAAAPVAVLDAELPLSDSPDRFTVKTEDGREFSRCLLASLKTDGSGNKRRLTYCLRCENVTAP